MKLGTRVLVFGLVVLFSLQVHAACNPQCVISECTSSRCAANGTCIYTAIPEEAPAAGCCETQQPLECATGLNLRTNSDLHDCLEPSCDSNSFTCANLWTCSTSDFGLNLRCTIDANCQTLNTYCTVPKCVSNYCTLDVVPVDPLPFGCCNATSDCTDIPGLIKYCNDFYHLCVYTEAASPTPSTSTTQSITATPSNTPAPSQTTTPTISGSPTISDTPSSTASPSEEPESPTSTPSATPTSTGSISESITPTTSETPSPSESELLISDSPSSTSSVTQSASLPISATPSPVGSNSNSQSISASQTIPASMTVTVITSSEGDEDSSFWLWLLLGIAIIVIIVVVFLVFVGLWLRRRYYSLRYVPDDFIDDDEFPM